MTSVLLDTNVLFSAFITPGGLCGQLVKNLLSDTLYQPVTSALILKELYDLPNRPHLVNKITFGDMIIFLQYAMDEIPIVNPVEFSRTALTPEEKELTDPKDHHVLIAYKTSDIDYLVTGNKKDFPIGDYLKNPTEMISLLASS